MPNAKFWKHKSAEALSRTFIDLVLFDRMEAHQEELAAWNLVIRGECRIEAQTALEEKIVSGDADYVLGYDPIVPAGAKAFESCSVIIEAKRAMTFDEGLAQATAYLVGIQQRRRKLACPKRIVDTVYGMVSDGIAWQFLRLEGRNLNFSDRFTSYTARGRSHINYFVDTIIRAAISSTPHTTSPANRFPATQEQWRQNVETAIFGSIPPKFELQKSPTTPEEAFMVDDSDSVGSLDEVEEFEIVRLGRSMVKVLDSNSSSSSHQGFSPN